MRKLRPTVATTPQELAEALGLETADAKEWQMQYELPERRKQPKTTPVKPAGS